MQQAELGAGSHRGIRFRGPLEGFVEGGVHEGVELGIEPLDPFDRGLGGLRWRHLAIADGVSGADSRGGGKVEVSHHRSLAPVL